MYNHGGPFSNWRRIARPFAPIVSPFDSTEISERDKRWPWPMEIVFLVFSAGPTNLLGAANKPRLNGINASCTLPTFDTPPTPLSKPKKPVAPFAPRCPPTFISNGWKQNYYLPPRSQVNLT